MSKADRNRQTARAKIARMQAAGAQRRRHRNWIAGIGAAVLVILAITGITLAVTSGSSAPATAKGGTPELKLAALSTLGTLQPAPAPGPSGPEGVPVPDAAPLAGTATGATGAQTDGISCQATEQSIFHIHAHLTIFINGAARQIPADIGIPGSCLYLLHTHAADGIIHIQSPRFAAPSPWASSSTNWRGNANSGRDRIGPATGHVTALYNGKVYQGNPRDIPLNAHAQIQLETDTPLIAPEQSPSPAACNRPRAGSYPCPGRRRCTPRARRASGRLTPRADAAHDHRPAHKPARTPLHLARHRIDPGEFPSGPGPSREQETTAAHDRSPRPPGKTPPPPPSKWPPATADGHTTLPLRPRQNKQHPDWLGAARQNTLSWTVPCWMAASARLHRRRIGRPL